MPAQVLAASDLQPGQIFAGLDLLSSAVLLLDAAQCIVHCNPAAENLFAVSRRSCLGKPLAAVLGAVHGLQATLDHAGTDRWSHARHDIVVSRDKSEEIHLDCTVSPLALGALRFLLEFHPLDQQLRTAREEREALQQSANRELIRNLVHEIKNPLGGIRGAAQLLEHELETPALREYTQIIIAEADRLQDLMRRLLSSHRAIQPETLNIHAVLEPVLKLLAAEFPGIRVQRFYDTSLPDITGDRQQLTQVFLNIARNGAQAMHGSGEIGVHSRILRQVTLAKKRYRLALEVQIIDHGPGIPEDIREQIFFPLISRRAGGTGLGLALAHNLVQQHQGSIEIDSVPGRTVFAVRLPLFTSAKEDA
ncbi:nitrogen regulation protein NR(II) [Azonexus sp.]|uniref:nitrogen regulation protein NR(II) n=1 Tax=Azonexus sp. TaxID=1872668 RepID=UPI0039E697C2